MTYWLFFFIVFIPLSCVRNTADTFYQKKADLLLQKYDRKAAKQGIYEYREKEMGTPFIGSFKKYYITKQYSFSTMPEARAFFCSFFNELLVPFNENKELRPYLQNYPLSYEDLDLQIVFIDEKGKPLTYPDFWSVRKAGEYLYYEHFDPKINKSVAFDVEPVDRAFRIHQAKIRLQSE